MRRVAKAKYRRGVFFARQLAQEGGGFIFVQLKLGANVDFAATDVQQAVDAARVNLPSDLDPPVVTKADPNAQPILTEYLTSRKLSPVELSNLVENEILPALKSVHEVLSPDGLMLTAGTSQLDLPKP